MKAVTTLVVVANDKKARFLENLGVGKGLAELSEIAASEFSDVETRYSDRPGRAQASAGSGVHAVERTTSEERQERQAFARHVLSRTGKLMQKGGYDRLAIAAAPRMLGELRDEMADELKNRLAFDLDKDLVKIPLIKLVSHFGEKVAF